MPVELTSEKPSSVPQRFSTTWKEVFGDCDAHLRIITGLLLGGDDQVVSVLLKGRKSLERSCSVPSCPSEAYSLARKRMIHYVLQLLEPERQRKLRTEFSSTVRRRGDDIVSSFPGHDETALLASFKTLLNPEVRL